MLVDNLLREADSAANPLEAQALLQRAELTMLDAQRWSDLNRSAYYLGQIYRQMALLESTPHSSRYAVKAVDAFAQARRVEPLWESVWRESALVDLLVQDSPVAATAKLAQAKTLGQSAVSVSGGALRRKSLADTPAQSGQPLHQRGSRVFRCRAPAVC